MADLQRRRRGARRRRARFVFRAAKEAGKGDMNARAALFLAFIVVVCADEGAKFCARRMFDAPRVIGAATLSTPVQSELAFPSALHHRSVRYALYALAAVGLLLIANAARTSVP